MAAKAKRRGADGKISLRAGARVFEEALTAETEVVAEYLSGVLASSRSADATNDDGVSWAALVGQMSSTMLHAHYTVYSTVRALAILQRREVAETLGRPVLIPFFEAAREVTGQDEEGDDRFLTALTSLERLGLISSLSWGRSSSLVDVVNDRRWRTADSSEAESALVSLSTTFSGVGLFLWGLGAGGVAPDPWVDPDIDLRPTDDWLPREHITLSGFAMNLDGALRSGREKAQRLDGPVGEYFGFRDGETYDPNVRY